MRTKFSGILTLFLALFVQILFAQQQTVSGIVTDDTGLPLPGATVLVKGTTKGKSTNFDGEYSIQANIGQTLVFSYVGYATQEVKITSSTVNVQLKPGEQLEAVTVVAYGGAVNSAKVASAIATVDGATIEQVPINSLDQVLQGAAAGVNVSTGSGQPGQSATIIIRGRNSLQGDIEPLFVIDGVPVDQDNFRSLNQNDIESLSVLKDAAATAIYGNRGAGGVVLVTTKKGKKGSGVNIQYRTLYGVAVKPKTRFEVMNASQFLNFQKNLLPGNQFGDSLTDTQIAAIAAQTNTNWSDIFFQQGTTLSHEMSVSTGNENTSSYTSLQYFKQEGITLGSDLKRFSFRNNFNGSSNSKKFNYATNLTLNYSVSNFIVDATRGNNTGGQLDNPFIVPYIGLPYLSPYNPDGSLNIVGTQRSGALNPDGSVNASGANGFVNTAFLALNTARLNTDQESEFKAVGSISADYNFAKNLTIGGSVGIDYTNIELLQITTPGSIRGLITPNQGSEEKGSQSETFFRDANFITNAFLRYQNDITDKLNLTATVYGEYNYSNTQSAGFTAFGLNPALPGSGSGFTAGNTVEYPADSNNDGVDDPEDAVYNYIPGVASSETELALASLFGTLSLDWDGKYGLDGTIRRDQTSRFPKNSTGTFWSVAGRWNIDNEDFMSNVDFISILKLRASYGVVGNQNIGSRYQGLQTVNAGPSYQLATGYSLGTLVDEDIKWETSKQFNVGLSFGLWNNRLTGEFDYYDFLTDELFSNNKPLSLAGTGYSQVIANVGSMRNRGIDLQLSYDVLRKSESNPWSIRVHGNANYNKNVVEELPVGFTGNTLRVAEGRAAFTWNNVRWAGVDPSNGQPLYLDANGNITNVFDPANQVYLDKNFDPTYTGGFGADITYKGFTLSSLFSFVADRYRENSSLAIIEDSGLAGFANMSTSLLNAWTTPGQITDIPSLAFGGLRAVDGNRYLEDASFLRLRNVTLSYSVDPKILEKTNVLSGLRVYVQGTNLVTWTKWRGFDPESNQSTGFFDYPVPRTFSLGFDLNF
ncbi:SusC/RagA family TonB-linked outer membrane protein [Kordia zhangzhouensis]|uniref:SusC/RagA family TonB-linked outer membrane protein n=1 Tax=Kordia zhangzhouensis TaxID=1620405 RepID=UPI0006293E25|nr:SusC/RagA family TonB-linked outer membrane protein [Kordia zhangzhouensis]